MLSDYLGFKHVPRSHVQTVGVFSFGNGVLHVVSLLSV